MREQTRARRPRGFGDRVPRQAAAPTAPPHAASRVAPASGARALAAPLHVPGNEKGHVPRDDYRPPRHASVVGREPRAVRLDATDSTWNSVDAPMLSTAMVDRPLLRYSRFICNDAIADHTRAMQASPLPLGAVQTADGEVVVPASRRADGSLRKPIRIRQGYVAQDEVPKYKTVAQRRREQEALDKQRAQQTAQTDADELSLASLSLKSTATERPSDSRANERPAAQARAAREARDNAKPSRSDRTAALKQELTKLNKLLKEIAKLEATAAHDTEAKALSALESKKLARKDELQTKRNALIAELNGATVSTTTAAASSSSSAKKKTFVAIDL